jgi:hypothetical protein
VGPDTQPVTPDLRLAIQRAFASTISLNKFESQVTVTAAQAAPVTTIPTSPLSTGPTPGPRLGLSWWEGALLADCQSSAW